MNLQEQLFKSCLDELGKTQKLAEDYDYDSQKYVAQHARFAALYDFIEAAGLMEQYEEWRETNWTSVEMEEE